MKTILYNGKQVKLTPLLMKSELVSQTRKGLKTQTRRLNGLEEVNERPDKWELSSRKVNSKFFFTAKKDFDFPNGAEIKCPYGDTGDVIWVREMWSGNKELGFGYNNNDGFKPVIGWKPSIHMPKEACRLFLEITDIRPERLQDITEEDAIAEGIEKVGEVYQEEFKNYLYNENPTYASHSFFTLWESINGEESLLKDPWVWRIQFKQIPKPANWPA